MLMKRITMDKLGATGSRFVLIAIASTTIVDNANGDHSAIGDVFHDFSVNQVVEGGFTDADLRRVLDLGWMVSVFDDGILDPTPVIALDGMGGYVDNDFFLPIGTIILHPDNTLDSIAIVFSCGNPTCWRWMVNFPHTDITASEIERLADLPDPGPTDDPFMYFLINEYPVASLDPGYVYPDSVIASLTAIPEPASVYLLSLSSLALLRRRRRPGLGAALMDDPTHSLTASATKRS